MVDSTNKENGLLAYVTRAIVSVLLLVVSVGIFKYLKDSRPVPSKSASADALPVVAVLAATRKSVLRQWEGFGIAAAVTQVAVPARVTSTIVFLPADLLVGKPIKKGQQLARLDPSDFLRQVEIAQQELVQGQADLAQLANEMNYTVKQLALEKKANVLNERDYQRVRILFDRAAAKSQDVDRSEQRLIESQRGVLTLQEKNEQLKIQYKKRNAKILALQSTLKNTQQNLKRCTIVSPIDGILAAVDIEVGENIEAGKRLVQIVNLQQIEIPLQLPASSRPAVAVGDAVSLWTAKLMQAKWVGRVARIAPQDDSQTHTMTVYVEIKQDPQAAYLLVPGRFVQGLVTAKLPQSRWLVPSRSIKANQLLVVRDGQVTSRSVIVDFMIRGTFPEFGLTDTQWAALKVGLAEGEMVIVNPSRAIGDGAKVKPQLQIPTRTTKKDSREKSS